MKGVFLAVMAVLLSVDEGEDVGEVGLDLAEAAGVAPIGGVLLALGLELGELGGQLGELKLDGGGGQLEVLGCGGGELAFHVGAPQNSWTMKRAAGRPMYQPVSTQARSTMVMLVSSSSSC